MSKIVYSFLPSKQIDKTLFNNTESYCDTNQFYITVEKICKCVKKKTIRLPVHSMSPISPAIPETKDHQFTCKYNKVKCRELENRYLYFYGDIDFKVNDIILVHTYTRSLLSKRNKKTKKTIQYYVLICNSYERTHQWSQDQYETYKKKHNEIK